MRSPAPPLVSLLLVVLLAAPAAATSFVNYATVPIEHDDQGRSDEPDFAATSVLGPPLANCVASLDPFRVPGFARACTPDGQLPGQGTIAPGCTDDTGRRPSGLCALHSSGLRARDAPLLQPGVTGVAGMTGSSAPGRLTPTKGTMVRLFDLQVSASAPAASQVEVNRKLADAGIAPLLGSLDADLGAPFVAPAASLWAWYGVWQDKNGNGVIDHLGNEGGGAWAGNEFLWVGACGERGADVCLRETGLVMPFWAYPGAHHAGCGVFAGCYVPADIPGRQAACFGLNAATQGALLLCPAADAPDDESRTADPLLGPGGGIAADGELRDQTGDASPTARGWHSGPAPAYFYDQSLLTTTVLVSGPTLRGRDPGVAQGYDLASLQFADVDRHTPWLPVLGDLLQQSLRPAARSSWVAVRDSVPPLSAFADGAAHGASLDAPTQAFSSIDDALRDPGWSREPNTARDRFPAAVHGAYAPSPELPAAEQAHRGWLNEDAAHRSGWHAYADVQAQRLEFTYGNFLLGPACPSPCIGGAFLDSWSMLPAPGEPLRPGGDHRRSLDPGAYQMRGFVGAWRDQPHAMRERVLDPLASLAALAPVVREEAYVLPADGWVGNIVNTTGALRSRGYSDEACTIQGVSAVRAWAVCHPYLDTALAAADSEAGLDQSFGVDLSDPQDYLDATEFQRLTVPPASDVVVIVRPVGGVWTVPVFVWRDFYHWQHGDVGAFEDLTGSSRPIVLATLPQLVASLRSRVVTQDLLVLPLGNQGLAVETEFAMRVQLSVPTRGIAVDEVVVDVDAYRPWG